MIDTIFNQAGKYDDEIRSHGMQLNQVAASKHIEMSNYGTEPGIINSSQPASVKGRLL